MSKHTITFGDFTLFHLICISKLPTALAEPAAGPTLAYARLAHPRHLATINVLSKGISLFGVLEDTRCS